MFVILDKIIAYDITLLFYFSLNLNFLLNLAIIWRFWIFITIIIANSVNLYSITIDYRVNLTFSLHIQFLYSFVMFCQFCPLEVSSHTNRYITTEGYVYFLKDLFTYVLVFWCFCFHILYAIMLLFIL